MSESLRDVIDWGENVMQNTHNRNVLVLLVLGWRQLHSRDTLSIVQPWHDQFTWSIARANSQAHTYPVATALGNPPMLPWANKAGVQAPAATTTRSAIMVVPSENRTPLTFRLPCEVVVVNR